MKKFTFMRLACVLLVAVMLSTCAISGTFAKYTSSVSSEDSARVAYWGWKATTMDITGLFAKAYTDEPDTTGTKVNSTVDVIAPGTKNSAKFAFAYDVNGSINAPEVAYTFAVDVVATCDDSIKNNTNIQWKLDNGEWGTFDDMVKAIKALSGDESGSKDYAPGELPKAFTAADDTHTIAWQWIFETADNQETADTNEMAEQDKIDTEMGNASDLADVSIKITITATQID